MSLGLSILLAVCLAPVSDAIAPAYQGGKEVAILVGIGDYPASLGLERLQGPPTDVKKIQAALPKLGFHNPQVTILLHGQGTKQAIQTILKQQADQLGPNDRFLFYFAGHGTKEEKNVYLVPFDAKRDDRASHIAVEELLKWLEGIKADKTAILDACHSGRLAFVKAKGNEPINSRFAKTFTPLASKGPVDSDELDSLSYERLWQTQSTSPVKLVLACQTYQVANEWKEGTPGIPEPTGVFTNALTTRLQASTGDSLSWQTVTEDVRKTMEKELTQASVREIQIPQANRAALESNVGAGAGKPTQRPITELRDLYWKQAPDPDFTVFPSLPGGALPTAVPIGWAFDLKVTQPGSGSLAMILGDDQGFQVVFPPLNSAGQHSIAAGHKALPRGSTGKLVRTPTVRPYLPGELKIRSYYVPGAAPRDTAPFQAYLDAFTGEPFPQNSSKSLDVKEAMDYKTFDWSITVADMLVHKAELDESVAADMLASLASARKGSGSAAVQRIYSVVFGQGDSLDPKESGLAGGKKELLLGLLFGQKAQPATALRAVINMSCGARIYDPDAMAEIKAPSELASQLESQDINVRSKATLSLFNLIFPGLIKLAQG